MAMPYILDLLSNLKAKVATNETNIATNKTNIAANKKSIDDHKADDTRHWTTADRQNFNRVVHFKGYFTTESALTAGVASPQVGDYAIVGATDTVWLWDDTTNSWLNSTEQGIVISVNGRTGEVVLTKTDVGLGNVDNTADINKPVSKPQQTALDAKADRKKITEAEADGFTLRAGIYDLNNVSKEILGFTSNFWIVIVGENYGGGNIYSASQIWISYEYNKPLHMYFRFRNGATIETSIWSEFKEVATNTDISSLQTQITTNKNNIKTNADDIDTLEDNKANRGEITAAEADGFDLRAGIYEGNLPRTILGFQGNYWVVIVSEGVSKKTGTQIWIAYDSHHQNKHMYFRKVYNNSGTLVWTPYSEIITSDIISSAQITNINHYKGYFATAAALAATGTGTNGDYAIVGENQVMYIWNSTKNAWTSIINDSSLGSGTVTSVNGETGAVVLTKSSIGLTNVDNTADANKNVNSAKTLTTARKIDGVSFNGSADIIHYGQCTTAAATAAKTVSCPRIYISLWSKNCSKFLIC